MPKDHPLRTCENALITPHSSAMTPDYLRRGAVQQAEQMQKFPQGRTAAMGRVRSWQRPSTQSPVMDELFKSPDHSELGAQSKPQDFPDLDYKGLKKLTNRSHTVRALAASLFIAGLLQGIGSGYSSAGKILWPSLACTL